MRPVTTESEWQRAKLIGALIGVRRRLGISQVEMGRRLKISQAAVSYMERCSDWKISTLDDYARAVGVRLKLELGGPDGQIKNALSTGAEPE